PRDPDAPPPVERVLDQAEFGLLLAACETGREEIIIRLAAESGLRNGEVRGLRWPDLDLAVRRVHVCRSIWRNIVKTPKNGPARRRAGGRGGLRSRGTGQGRWPLSRGAGSPGGVGPPGATCASAVTAHRSSEPTRRSKSPSRFRDEQGSSSRRRTRGASRYCGL